MLRYFRCMTNSKPVININCHYFYFSIVIVILLLYHSSHCSAIISPIKQTLLTNRVQHIVGSSKVLRERQKDQLILICGLGFLEEEQPQRLPLLFLTKYLIVCCLHCVHKSCKGLSKNGELSWVELNWRQTIYIPLFIDSWGQDSEPAMTTLKQPLPSTPSPLPHCIPSV